MYFLTALVMLCLLVSLFTNREKENKCPDVKQAEFIPRPSIFFYISFQIFFFKKNRDEHRDLLLGMRHCEVT